jgi:hypothetical protein
MPSLTWAQVNARRLSRHGLTEPVTRDHLAEQVRAICGAHAQVMSAAETSIALRVLSATAADVRTALWEDRALVKAFGPRGTVHLLHAADLPAWNAVLGAALEPPGFASDVLMDERQTDAVVAALDAALAEDDRTLEELDAEVVRRAGRWAGDLVMPAFQDFWPRWRQAMRAAAFRGALCFGPNRGSRVTYTSPRRWLGTYREVPVPEATRTILHAYFRAYGPSRPEFLGRWLYGSPAWARGAFQLLRDDLAPVDVEGERLWQLAGDPVPDDELHGVVLLLPYFDAYAVGCHPRDRVFPGNAAERALARGGAGNVRVLLIDGTVAGIWHQRRSGKRLELTVEPFRRLSTRERKALDEQAERIGHIQGARATLTIGTVTAGPHA